ncbi:MAG: preprotein translocase subunit SecY [Parcubacteria group bacterium LiPW_15]|nr:MAG: preprotein translocase subunit SecY [Parcubacteria group bacterium LiPW_15]
MNKFLELFRVKDLRNKVLIVLGLLVAFRVLASIPIPGVDPARLAQFLASSQLFGFLNLFSGGGLTNLSLAMLGVGPYITATIIMQLLTIIFPKMKQLYYEEGARGQAKFNQYSRILTIPLAVLQGFGFLNLLISQGAIARPSALGMLTNILAITAGSMLALWFGELISEQKVGNGISLIILAGIVSQLPTDFRLLIASYTPAMLPTYVGFAIIAIGIIAAVVYLNEGERKIPIAYARRIRGNKMYGGSSSYLPLKVNQAGMIPLIFAVSVLLFPQFFAQVVSVFSADLGLKLHTAISTFLANQLWYGLLYFILVVAFTFFYSAITFNPEEVAKNLQRGGGFVTGIRPGEATASFFKRILSRVNLSGAVFLGLIAVLPIFVQTVTKVSALQISGTSLLIVVAVVLETMRQVNSQLTIRGYEGLE